MKQYFVSAVVSVSDECRGRRPDADMMHRWIKESVKVGVIDQSLFRGRVTMELKHIKFNVMETDFPIG